MGVLSLDKNSFGIDYTIVYETDANGRITLNLQELFNIPITTLCRLRVEKRSSDYIYSYNDFKENSVFGDMDEYSQSEIKLEFNKDLSTPFTNQSGYPEVIPDSMYDVYTTNVYDTNLKEGKVVKLHVETVFSFPYSPVHLENLNSN